MRMSAEQQQNNEVESFLFDNNTIGLRPPLLLVVRSIPKKINCSEIVQRQAAGNWKETVLEGSLYRRFVQWTDD